MITSILSILVNGFLLNLLLQVAALLYSKFSAVDPILLHKKALALAVMILCAVLLIGVTPLGEWYMRRNEKCRKGKLADFKHLHCLFDEVCLRAGIDPNQYNLYVSLKAGKNAFAAGKKTVAATTGLMSVQNDSQIMGVLAHEMGHHLLGHTVWFRFTFFSGLVGQCTLEVYSLISQCVSLLTRIPLLGWIVRPVTWALFILVKLLQFILVLPFNLGALFGARRDEYAADLFAAQLGYGKGLRDFLMYEILPYEEKSGVFRRLFHTHPRTEKRILRLEKELGL